MKKSKRAQESIGMSFTMIFSILIIVFFFVAAFFAIDYFLDFQKTSLVGLFVEDLQGTVDEAWYSSTDSEFFFNSTLPLKMKYVCFINISQSPTNSDPLEREIYEKIKWSGVAGDKVNMIFYPTEIVEKMTFQNIKHIKIPDDNPHCIKIEEGKISMRVKLKLDESPLVQVE